MLVTELYKDDYIAVKCNYSKEYVARFKRIATCYYDKECSNKWLFKKNYFHTFETLFKGEIVYKTPRWVILNEPMPDYSKMYQIDHSIQLPKFKIKPYDYQEFGIKFMVDRLLKHRFVLNADDVGIGKTAQAIGTFSWFIDNKGYTKILIACKKSIRKQWISEIKKFIGLENFHMAIIGGTKKQRKDIYNGALMSGNFILAGTYETIMQDEKLIKSLKLGIDMMIIDEAHIVKAKNGKKHNALQAIADTVKKIIFLTGTPIMSRPVDVYGVISIADKKYFGMSPEAFEKYFVKQEWNGSYKKTIGFMHLDELRDMVQEVLIRRTEFEVNIQLPKVIPKKIEVDMDTTQQSFIDRITDERNKLLAAIQNLRQQYVRAKTAHERDEIYRKSLVFTAASKGYIACFQAIANDPRMFRYSKSQKLREKYTPMIPSAYKTSNKTDALLDLLDDIFEADEKAIVFSKYERSVLMLKEDIEKTLHVKVLTYTGQKEDDEREDALDLFQNNDDYKIILGTDALAEGVNLQQARHVIHYDQPDTLAIKTQRIGRTRRASSKFKTNFSYDLITLGSKDEDKLKDLEKQGNLVDCVVNLDKAQSESLKKAMYG